MKISESRRSDLGEEFAFYVIFEEGLVICIKNALSAKSPVHRASTVKGIALLQKYFSKNTLYRVQIVLIVLKQEVYDEYVISGVKLDVLLNSAKSEYNNFKPSKQHRITKHNCL